ncbi:hypothetical protein Q3G72_017902 [Acer saccharum]|nr:hypothetical protein Q3G72_017902 [Acer saccharum]
MTEGIEDYNLMYGAWLKASSPLKNHLVRQQHEGVRDGGDSAIDSDSGRKVEISRVDVPLSPVAGGEATMAVVGQLVGKSVVGSVEQLTETAGLKRGNSESSAHEGNGKKASDMGLNCDDGVMEMNLVLGSIKKPMSNGCGPTLSTGNVVQSVNVDGLKEGKWKRRAWAGSRIDSDMVADTLLGKHPLVGGSISAEKKLKSDYSGSVSYGKFVVSDDISAEDEECADIIHKSWGCRADLDGMSGVLSDINCCTKRLGRWYGSKKRNWLDKIRVKQHELQVESNSISTGSWARIR